MQRGLLTASTTIAPADVFVIAVPTPFAKDATIHPTQAMAWKSCVEVAAVIKKGDTVILEVDLAGRHYRSYAGCDRAADQGRTSNCRGWASPGSPTSASPTVPNAFCPGKWLEELTHNDRSIGDHAALRAQGAGVLQTLREGRMRDRPTPAAQE